MSSRAWILVVLLSACTTPNPRSCLDGVCDDPRYPFCDVNGDIGGAPNTCIEGQCEPNAIAGCQDDDLVTCNANGTNFVTSNCDFGCQGTDAQASCNLCEPNTKSCDGDRINHCGTDGRVQSVEECVGTCVADSLARCTNIVPRYLPNVCDEPAAEPTLSIQNTATFDTNLDSNCNGGIILQGGAPAICVVRYGSIVIGESAELTVSGARVLALVSDEETKVAGYLDLSAGDGFNGPGGGFTLSGGNGTMMNGLGGAGFFTNGGAGGDATTDGGANNGGLASADPATLAVLIGGPQSGNGSFVIGGGGGAATLVSCRGNVVVSGEINAGGGGGSGGYFNGLFVLPGAGGGAGGYVVLQGMRVSVTGKLFANGGGGGAGMRGSQTGGKGFEGARSMSAAFGGLAPADGATGGFGGTGSSAGGSGQKVGTAGGNAGGGGGSAGFFQTYTPVGVGAVITPSMASPTPRPNANIPTH